MSGLYLHIPFCKQACYYCDFHFSTNQTIRTELVQSMVEEMRLRKDYLQGKRLGTIYYGGGTPSILSPEELDRLQAAIHTYFDATTAGEITLEANPDDLSSSKLQVLKSSGFNRLSIGIQSFDNSVLQYLHRAHDATMALDTFDLARSAGFNNISVDLIYAIPGQDIETWKANIIQALSLEPEHISAYSLTIEERTVFGNWASKGKLIKVPEDEAAYQMELLVELLSARGYEQYEVSNFCRPGYRARHNSQYWQNQPYLGIGPSAHSYDLVSRQYNVSNNHQYVRAIHSGEIPATIEVLDRKDQINERLLTGLRTVWGCDLNSLATEFSYDLSDTKQEYLQQLFADELAILKGANLCLTPLGLLFADKIACDLFAE